MNHTLITSLVVLTLVSSCISQYRNTYNDPYVPTRSCVCQSRFSGRCPSVGYCPSGTVRRCGCCPTCYRLLGAGERCDRRVPVNEMCRRPFVCMSSICQRPRYQNGYK